MKLQPFFASGPSFLDPQQSKDGSAYGPKRYKELVKECEKLAKQSLKVIAFSYQEEVHDQSVFLAIVGLFDPPRKNIEKSNSNT